MDLTKVVSEINVNAHSSIKVDKIYFDPFMIDKKTNDAKYIFISHTHYDHLSGKDIDKVISLSSIIIATADAESKLAKYKNKKIFVKPNEKYEVDDLKFETFSSYNINKSFHKKEYNWVGYKVTIGGVSYAVLGDTDVTDEVLNLSCDVLFVPIGGTYTMNAVEAAQATNKIKPKIAIPVHYGSVVGSKSDLDNFVANLDESIFCKSYF